MCAVFVDVMLVHCRRQDSVNIALKKYLFILERESVRVGGGAEAEKQTPR